MFFAYFGPETTLPLASVLAASLGFIMMMGRRSLRIVAQIARFAMPWLRKPAKSSSDVIHMPPGMRGDHPHQNGDLPSWVRPKRESASSSSTPMGGREQED